MINHRRHVAGLDAERRLLVAVLDQSLLCAKQHRILTPSVGSVNVNDSSLPQAWAGHDGQDETPPFFIELRCHDRQVSATNTF